MQNLVGYPPKNALLHGSTKRLVDEFLWHQPDKGIVASYTPKKRDVKDHFDLFRGVDQIESFAQASIGACGVFSECKKHHLNQLQLKEKFVPTFISIGQVIFHYYLMVDETFICMANIKFYKFRQMIADGRIYKVPRELDLKQYFKDFNAEDLKNYNLSKDFKLVAELFDVTGRAIKKDILF
ncbi:MAG: hypothetical protein IE931_02350 [Sphingobacteriales bacterium]|nr:hypothetical protein [Sphingobacteriales bacterium]